MEPPSKLEGYDPLVITHSFRDSRLALTIDIKEGDDKKSPFTVCADQLIRLTNASTFFQTLGVWPAQIGKQFNIAVTIAAACANEERDQPVTEAVISFERMCALFVGALYRAAIEIRPNSLVHFDIICSLRPITPGDLSNSKWVVLTQKGAEPPERNLFRGILSALLSTTGAKIYAVVRKLLQTDIDEVKNQMTQYTLAYNAGVANNVTVDPSYVYQQFINACKAWHTYELHDQRGVHVIIMPHVHLKDPAYQMTQAQKDTHYKLLMGRFGADLWDDVRINTGTGSPPPTSSLREVIQMYNRSILHALNKDERGILRILVDKYKNMDVYKPGDRVGTISRIRDELKRDTQYNTGSDKILNALDVQLKILYARVTVQQREKSYIITMEKTTSDQAIVAMINAGTSLKIDPFPLCYWAAFFHEIILTEAKRADIARSDSISSASKRVPPAHTARMCVQCNKPAPTQAIA